MQRGEVKCGVMLLAGLVFLGLATSVRAGSVKPSPPSVSYSNTVNFNFTSNVFRFTYSGVDGTVDYEYAPGGNGSFHPLRCTVNGTNSFLPSNVGGLSLVSNVTEIYPWQAGVSFQLLDAHATNDTLLTTWKMSYGTNNLTYGYQFQISARTLVIQAAVSNGVSGGLYFDRCEGATNPAIIRVPSLTTMNVLLAGGAFASLFVDWEVTEASDIGWLDSPFSPTSVYFAQQARYLPRTDGTRNKLNETIYLTASPTLTDVLPNVTNPMSPLKSLVSQRIIFDYWQTPFSSAKSNVQSLRNAGVSNIWVIVHVWQNGGFDNKLPDVLPANSSYGGDAGLRTLSETVRTNGYLFSLHENYVDFYSNSVSWNTNHVARNGDGSLKLAWYNSSTHIQSYEMKPSSVSNYLTTFAPQIHSNYTTTASFLDVHSAANPSYKVDYDAGVVNAGKFRETMTRYRSAAALLRNFHQGPVSGEGDAHMFYSGYYDDIEAQLNCASAGGGIRGSWLPLLVDFDLLKLHDKTLTHGVGYYERYFCDFDGNSQFISFPKDKVLAYMAAELAYGRGGFIPSQDRVYDHVEVAKLEQRHVLSAQKLYATAMPVSILYHDPASNDLVTASDYIRRYPKTFDNATNASFMSQVRVTYDNGVVVCANRHPSQSWQVTLGHPGGWFNYNAVMNGTSAQWVGTTNLTSYLLPANNGWVVFAPIPAPPTILRVMLTNAMLDLSITNLLPGTSNRIEQSFDMADNNWQTADVFVAAGTETNWLQPITTNKSFYRVARFW
jgi:hypothetical protein